MTPFAGGEVYNTHRLGCIYAPLGGWGCIYKGVSGNYPLTQKRGQIN